jgi:hypothetical protein
MKKFDCRGRKINYDAPGQLGAWSAKPEKLPVDRFIQQLNRLVDYYDARGQRELTLHVTYEQLRGLERIDPDDRCWKPTGKETYRNHVLIVTDDP